MSSGRDGTPAEPLPSPSALLDLRGRVVVVTGSAGGIGAGVARRFSAAGAAVVLHARSSDLETVAAGLPGPTATVRADVTETDGPDRLVAAAVEAFGRLDALVNNAAVQPLARLADVPPEEWRHVLEVNVTSVHRLTQVAAGRMRAQGDDGRMRAQGHDGRMRAWGDRGAIVHIASIEAHQPAPSHGHYAAAKAAVVMHARAAAAELGPDGIRVNSVSPGLIDRPGLAVDWPDGVARWTGAAPLGRLGTPEDVGDACVFLCSPLARWITGADLLVDGGVLTRPTW